jgi:DNA-binding HxlR family transcriptional regulator
MPQESEPNQFKAKDRLKKKVLGEPAEIRMILQKDKLQILNILLKEEKNIQQLKEATGINPGTIKRNLDDLIKNNLVFESAVKKSDYNITMKYYLAVAEEFEIKFAMPVGDLSIFLAKYEKEKN